MQQNFEIERKFLVKDDSWRNMVIKSIRLQQGYICYNPEHTVRVRIQDKQASLTVKGKGFKHPEINLSIKLADAQQLLEVFCNNRIIIKTRNIVIFENKTWEIDLFEQPQNGLILAEVELKTVDEQILLPPWLGEEVTGNHKYSNSHIAQSL